MARTVVCLGLGAFLWLQLGAVRGATRWQISGDEYLIGLAVAGALLGAVWPDRHVRTGTWIVLPGGAALFWLEVAGGGTGGDTFWWVLTVVVGVYISAGGHWAVVELRRMVARLRGRVRHC
jgi:hypothetical protein